MKVQVHTIFSHNNMIGSKIIAAGTAHLAKSINEHVSHVALLVNNRWVHEATGHSGVRVISYDAWSKLNAEVARVQLKDMEYQTLADKFRAIQGKKYDYLGILFFCMVVPFTFIGLPLPKRNLFESKDKYFCCEVIGSLTNQYYGMCAPVQILKSLRGSVS